MFQSGVGRPTEHQIGASMLKKLIRKKIIKSAKEVNKLLSYVDYYGLTKVCIGNGQECKSLEAWKLKNKVYHTPLSQFIIINLKDTKLEITTRYHDYGKPTTYIFDLNEEDIFSVTGLDCFTQFSRALKIPKVETYDNPVIKKYLDREKGKYVCSASPILSYNKKYEKQYLTDCYEYDINSAYSATLLRQIPDLYNPVTANYPEMVKVNKNEVGFMLDDQLTMVEPGKYADIKFKLIETPLSLKNFINKWYNVKKTSTGLEKLRAKAMLNLPIGYSQRYNPFLRAYVVHNCNKVIKSLIDDDTLFWNTDAIFTKKRRSDISLGNEIGEFKEIHCRELTYIGNTYQINGEDPTYRGISKAWFKAFEKKYGRKYDLLKDHNKQIERINYWSLNWTTLKLEVNRYEKVN